jgi:hypothetical protein
MERKVTKLREVLKNVKPETCGTLMSYGPNWEPICPLAHAVGPLGPEDIKVCHTSGTSIFFAHKLGVSLNEVKLFIQYVDHGYVLGDIKDRISQALDCVDKYLNSPLVTLL